jgi:hypothetical protein
MDNRPMQNDTWQCRNCESLNLIANANEQCPDCGHIRDYSIGCCTNPGDLSQSSGLFPGHPEHQADGCTIPTVGYRLHGGVVDGHEEDMWICGGCGAENPSWHTFCPLCGRDSNANASMQCAMSLGTTFSNGGAGSAAEGAWYCQNPNCGSSNASFHWPQCGACGTVHA